MKCPTCGASLFGKDNCIVCKREFLKRHRNQITCGTPKCRTKNQLQQQKIWKKKNEDILASERYIGELVVCIICNKRVKKVRSNQTTCYSKECLRKHSRSGKLRGIRHTHVRDLG